MVDYDTALKIDMNKDLFNYALNIKVGNTLVRGNFKTTENATFPEIGGSYMSVQKVKEVYKMHTSTSCNSKGQCTTRTYWTWDYDGEENKNVQNVTFLENQYNYTMFRDYPRSYLKTIRESSHVRYKYYVVPTSFDGVIFINTIDGYLKPYSGDKVSINAYMTIKETIQNKSLIFTLIKMGYWVIIFTTAGICVYKYVEANNYYLNDD